MMPAGLVRRIALAALPLGLTGHVPDGADGQVVANSFYGLSSSSSAFASFRSAVSKPSVNQL